MRILRQLSGNSGCSTVLCESQGRLVVRKSSPDHTYNVRLRNQVEKLYQLYGQRYLKVPQIHRVGLERGGRLFYEMDYISGVTYGDYTNTAGIIQVLETMADILRWIEDQALPRSGCDTFDVVRVVEGKKDELRGRLGDHRSLVDLLPPIPPADLPVTFCHGDLTFENIIVDRHGEPALIDPLDAYLPSYFADVTKLAKELWAFWSRISSGTHINIGVYHALRRQLLNSHVWEGYGPYMKTLVGIDLLRTLPYLEGPRQSIIPEVIRAYKCIVTP